MRVLSERPAADRVGAGPGTAAQVALPALLCSPSSCLPWPRGQHFMSATERLMTRWPSAAIAARRLFRQWARRRDGDDEAMLAALEAGPLAGRRDRMRARTRTR